MEYTKIPRNRVGILIGKEGGIKKEIEERLDVRLSINQEEGLVTIENLGEDVLAEWKAKDIITAIAKGLNPEKAIQLATDEYTIRIINLYELLGRSRKVLIRQKGRIIGRKGKTRKFIEETSGCSLSISGKHIVIVGLPEEVEIAEEAVKMLASGKPHGVVYKVLQRKVGELKKIRLGLWK